MIKRLSIIVLITGLGHLGTLLSLKYISEYISKDVIALIGTTDSLVLILASIIAFGLQLSATRNLAIVDDWEKEYYTTQSARLTLSLFLFAYGFLGFIVAENFTYLLAPLIALNADFALYGRGKPITGAIVALIRVLLPSLTLVFGSIYYPDILIFLFYISIALAYLVCGIVVSKSLDVKYFVWPKLINLIEYYKNLNIGLATVAFMFLGIGIVNVASYFHNDSTVAVIYIALKFYVIFKGARRIVVQSFFIELREQSMAVKVDYFGIIVGVLFLVVILFYPNILIPFLFDSQYLDYKSVFIILGVAALISSYTTSSGTRLLLNKNDNNYSLNLIIAAVVVVISAILFRWIFGDYPVNIAISVLIGEIVLTWLNILSLKEKGYLIKRLNVSYTVILIGLFLGGSTMIFGQTWVTFIVGIALYGILVLIYSIKLKFV